VTQPIPYTPSGPTSPRIYSKNLTLAIHFAPQRRRPQPHGLARDLIIRNSTALSSTVPQGHSLSLPRGDDWATAAAAQVPIGPFARSSSGSSPPTSSARYAHRSLPFLLCEAKNPNPNLSCLSPDLIKLEMYTVFCLLTSFFLFCKNYLLHNYVLYCISFVPPRDREIQFNWFILLVYSCVFCYCDILCY